MPHTLRTYLLACTKQLQEHQIDSPKLSAEVLLAFCMSLTRQDFLKTLIISPHTPLTNEVVLAMQQLVTRRCKGEPVAYLTHNKEFYGRDFVVNQHTLIPRPETELLIESACAYANSLPPSQSPLWFVDMGTGSGCIGVTLACELPHWRGILVDASKQALATAKQNATNLAVSSLHFTAADFTTPILQPNSVQLFVTNPPYISEVEYQTLSHEVKLFEPKSALVPTKTGKSGTATSCAPLPATGLEDAIALIALASTALCSGGMFIMEFGYTQGEAVKAMFNPLLWHSVFVHKDLAGLDRYVIATRG